MTDHQPSDEELASQQANAAAAAAAKSLAADVKALEAKHRDDAEAKSERPGK